MKLTEKQKEIVDKLRSEVPVGIMTCKMSLINHDWDYEKAKKDVLDPKHLRI